MSVRTGRLLIFAFFFVHSIGEIHCTGTFGRDFYIGILKSYTDSDIGFSLFITADLTGSATISVPYLGIHTTRNFNLNLEYKVTDDTVTKVNSTVEHKGIHVTTDVDVTLTVMTYPSHIWEGLLALPSNMLSTKYIISSYERTGTNYDSDFLVLGVHNNTLIRIYFDNSILNITMDRLDTYFVMRPNDLSGVIVSGDKPFAVFSGHEAASVPRSCGISTYFVEQLLPTLHFDREFIVPSLPPKSKYVVRIYSSDKNTSVSFQNTTSRNEKLLLKSGDFHEILSDSDPMYIVANKPVQVMLYSTCVNDNNQGGPFMSLVPAIQQYKNSYHFTVIDSSGHSDFHDDHFINYLIIISQSEYISGLRLNGNQMGNIFRSFGTSANHATFTVNVYKLTPGEYHLYHVTGRTFGAIQYGFYFNVAYGYPLGIEDYKESDDGLSCFDCKGMTHLYLCDTVTKCSGGQVCYVETYRTSSGQVKYNSGCLHYKQCSSQKRQSTSECVHCCSSKLCNSNGCGAEGLPPAFLRGPLCYDCPYVSNMDECTSVMLCAKDQVCSIEKYDFGGFYDHYTTKCHNKQCISHKREVDVTSTRKLRSTSICKSCCKADLCNIDCLITSQNGTDPIVVG